MNNVIIINPGNGGSDPALAGRVANAEQNIDSLINQINQVSEQLLPLVGIVDLVGAPKTPSVAEGIATAYPKGPSTLALLGMMFTIPPTDHGGDAANKIHMAIQAAGIRNIQIFQAEPDRLVMIRTDGEIVIDDGEAFGFENKMYEFVPPTGIFNELDFIASQLPNFYERLNALETLIEVQTPEGTQYMTPNQAIQYLAANQ